MAIERKDEVLGKAVASDAQVVPRYRLVKEDGAVVAEHVELVLENPVLQQGMPYNKDFANEVLAASGVTEGTAEALLLPQPGYVLNAGDIARICPHVDVTGLQAIATLNVQGTGAYPIQSLDDDTIGAGKSIPLYTSRYYTLVFNGRAWVLLGVVSRADKLRTARTIQTNLATTAPAAFDGSANVTPGVTGTLPAANGGTGYTSLQATRSAMGLGNTLSYLPLANGGTGRSDGIAAANVLGGSLTARINAVSLDINGPAVRNIIFRNASSVQVASDRLYVNRK